MTSTHSPLHCQPVLLWLLCDIAFEKALNELAGHFHEVDVEKTVLENATRCMGAFLDPCASRIRALGDQWPVHGQAKELVNHMSSSDHWTYYFPEIKVSEDRRRPPAGCPQDSGNRAVFPQEHRGSNATDVVGMDLKLVAGRWGNGRVCDCGSGLACVVYVAPREREGSLQHIATESREGTGCLACHKTPADQDSECEGNEQAPAQLIGALQLARVTLRAVGVMYAASSLGAVFYPLVSTLVRTGHRAQ
ncbi:hypothetical protein E2C01_052095 [Portunus trituberculatus]|uniref:Uncharacterized protein n=1 Tax=Portunus trituberculatus TaxID=210409 RepID=A0A5B7GM46_PORTR|nr:hypothetical protein [Portunus trituberculatus]